MKRVFVYAGVAMILLIAACGGADGGDTEQFPAPVSETVECLDAYNKAVAEWDAHVAANDGYGDAVSDKYSIWNDGGGFDTWAEDMGYAEGFCTA